MKLLKISKSAKNKHSQYRIKYYTQLIIFAYSPFTVNKNGTRQFKNMRAVLKHTAETQFWNNWVLYEKQSFITLSLGKLTL